MQLQRGARKMLGTGHWRRLLLPPAMNAAYLLNHRPTKQSLQLIQIHRYGQMFIKPSLA